LLTAFESRVLPFRGSCYHVLDIPTASAVGYVFASLTGLLRLTDFRFHF